MFKILSLFILGNFSFVQSSQFYGDSRFKTFQKTENTLSLGTGYSSTECALRCKLKKKKQFVKVENTGECLCDDRFVKVKEEVNEQVSEDENAEGVVFEASQHITPRKSCRKIKESKSGYYYVMFDKVTRVYCDMETQGGGWMAITNLTADGNTPIPEEATYTYDIHEMGKISDGRFLLAMSEVARLQQYIGRITQFRFYCTKAWHGRIVHVTNKLNEAGLLLRDSALDKDIRWVSVDACPGPDALYRLEDDTSTLLQCPYRNRNIYGMTAENIIYDHFLYTNNVATLYLKRFECDDLSGYSGFTKNGQWIYYVR
eukprot:TCONS_00003192-protein